MTFSRTTIIGIVISVLTILVLVFGSYFLFYRNKGTSPSGGTLPSASNSNPTSNTGTANIGNATGDTGDNTSSGEPILFQIHDRPIVSFVIFSRGGSPLIRFMEQGSGHVYEYDSSTKQKVRISNTSIPQIGNAVWNRDGNTIAFQYVDKGVIKTALAELATSSVESSLKKITFMPDNIGSVALSPDGSSVAYVTNTKDGAQVSVSQKNGADAHVVFTSPLPKWLISWPGTNVFIVETPLSTQGGAAYQINPTTGSKKLLTTTQSAFSGVIANPDGTGYLGPNGDTGDITFFDSKSVKSFTGTIHSISDKCSFVATSTSYAICGTYKNTSNPIISNFEGWLRGEFVSDDAVAIIGLKDPYWALPLSAGVLGDKVFDIEHIETGGNLSFAAFKEKVGATLWGINLNQNLFLN